MLNDAIFVPKKTSGRGRGEKLFSKLPSVVRLLARYGVVEFRIYPATGKHTRSFSKIEAHQSRSEFCFAQMNSTLASRVECLLRGVDRTTRRP
jgi:hypothetical protein